MRKHPLKKAARIVLTAILVCPLIIAVEILLAIPGPDDRFRNPDRQPVHFDGRGAPRVYVVMGDSTAAGRGGRYETGIAMETARHLARSGPVMMVNLAASGAKVGDVGRDQLPAARRLRPDFVLLSVGANDVTHFTPSRKIESELTRILEGIAASRRGTRIVVTGSPDVGAARRLAQPLRWLAGIETKRVNRVIEAVGRKHRVTRAPIARETGPLFEKDAGLFAPDRFHPNDRGYAAWLPVLYAAMDEALRH